MAWRDGRTRHLSSLKLLPRVIYTSTPNQRHNLKTVYVDNGKENCPCGWELLDYYVPFFFSVCLGEFGLIHFIALSSSTWRIHRRLLGEVSSLHFSLISLVSHSHTSPFKTNWCKLIKMGVNKTLQFAFCPFFSPSSKTNGSRTILLSAIHIKDINNESQHSFLPRQNMILDNFLIYLSNGLKFVQGMKSICHFISWNSLESYVGCTQSII